MGSSMIDLDEAEQSGYLFPVAGNDIAAEKKKAEYCASIAVRQHDLVVEQFGANAWDNVSYTIEGDRACRWRFGVSGEVDG